MTRILLVRHAETDPMRYRLCGRTAGIPLNSVGREQAARLSEGLRARSLEAVYSSPLERALETAQCFASAITVEYRLNELDFGDWTGKDFSELNEVALWHEYNRARSTVSPPSGEHPVEALERVKALMNDIASRHPNATVGVVTHADVIRSFLTSLLGMPLDYLLRIEIAPASVSEVSIGGAYPIVHSINRTL